MIKQITWDDQWIGYDDADTGTSSETLCYLLQTPSLHLTHSRTLILETPARCSTSMREGITNSETIDSGAKEEVGQRSMLRWNHDLECRF